MRGELLLNSLLTPLMSHFESQTIAGLNDLLRQTFTGGKVLLTEGIASLPDVPRLGILLQVQQYDQFTPDNDPYGEHDFGSFQYGELKIFWKIDYYDPDMEYCSADPSNPDMTVRVLTIMLADEY
jgi:hypothetical protein